MPSIWRNMILGDRKPRMLPSLNFTISRNDSVESRTHVYCCCVAVAGRLKIKFTGNFPIRVIWSWKLPELAPYFFTFHMLYNYYWMHRSMELSRHTNRFLCTEDERCCCCHITFQIKIKIQTENIRHFYVAEVGRCNFTTAGYHMVACMHILKCIIKPKQSFFSLFDSYVCKMFELKKNKINNTKKKLDTTIK